MNAKDIQYQFRAAILKHFKGTGFEVMVGYKENVVRIWQKIADTEDGYERNIQEMMEEDIHKLEIKRI
jgi:hypothetical protein